MIRQLVRTVAAATILLASSPIEPAGASSPPTRPLPEDVALDAEVALDSEILALVELGAFGANPPQVLLDVRDEWHEWIADLTRDELIAWAIDADREGAELLGQLVALGVPVSGEVRRALGPLSEADLDALAGGGRFPDDAGIWVRARGHLRAGLGAGPQQNGGRADGVAPAPTPNATAVQPPSPAGGTLPAQPVTVTTPSAGEPSSGATGVPVAIAGVVALVLAAGAIGVLIRRRRRPVAAGVAPGEQFDILAEAARRMTGSLDEKAIARIALDEALRMTRSRHGAFITVDEAGLTATATFGDVFALRSLTGGLLSRVADTGQTVRRIAHDEPAITSLPAALLAAPIIGGGRVVAILFLVQPDAAPFGEADEVAMSRLTPIVASALGAASKHGDATALSRLDPLTGLANRRTLDEDLAELAPTATPGRSTGLLMIDVDHFKHFNDRNGHAAGDEALRAVAGVLQAGVRAGDRVYRYGGEEFSVVMPDADRAEAEQVAERLRVLVERISVPGSAEQPGGTLTISVGIALVSGTEPEAALRLADRALYDAKSAGRNRVAVSGSVS